MRKGAHEKTRRDADFPDAIKMRGRGNGYRTAILLASTLLVILLMILAAGFIYLNNFIRPPQKRTDSVTAPAITADATDASDGQQEIRIREEGRKENVFTMLVLGLDVSERRSDTIIAATFDVENQSVAVLNIPRDTVSSYNGGKIHKINSAYGSGGSARTIAEVEQLLGYPIDRSVVITCDGFKALIDAIGGVDFEVPKDMYKVTDDMVIDLKEGQQHLDGEHALMYMRYRGYANADLSRIKAQQSFYKAVLRQLAQPATVFRLPAIASAVEKHVQTDISFGEMLWIGMKYCTMNTDDLVMNTMPNTPQYIGSASYVVPRGEALLELVNQYYNPYLEPIEALGLTPVPASAEPSQAASAQTDMPKNDASSAPQSDAPKDEVPGTYWPEPDDWIDTWEDWSLLNPDDGTDG